MPSEPSGPLLLAFDTSAAHCAAALVSGDHLLAAKQVDMAKGQAEALMPLVQEVLATAGVAPADLSAIGVGIGPGNFTGIRISVSAARGLALALGVPAIGVTTFEILRGLTAVTDPRPQLVCLPGPRGTVYVQLFEAGEATGAPRQIDPGAPPEDLILPPGTEVLGAEAATLARAFPNASATPAALGDVAPRLAQIAMAKARARRDHPRPAPLYVRPADAAPARDTGPVLLP